MRGRKTVVLLWVMLLLAVFLTGGCKRDEREDGLVSVGESDISADEDAQYTDSAGDGAEKRSGQKTSDGMPADEEAAGEAAVIYVDVCGQVKKPGVYELAGESRVYEAIEKAGGMTKEAEGASVNQAERLTDGQQIYVPSKDEQEEVRGNAAVPASKNEAAAAGGRVNLNSASKEELMTLSGIGEVKADAVIRYREEHGGFQSVEDIKKIEGIKDGVFNKIKDQITI